MNNSEHWERPVCPRIAANCSGTVNYAYDGANAIEEVNTLGAVIARYVQGTGIDEPLAQSRSGLSFYQADGLGSVTALADSSGTAVATYTYDAFGNLTASAGSDGNPYRYTAREYDPETGLYYYRARYYDSSEGRFLTLDPLSWSSGSDNFYSYAENQPTRFTDPLGLCVISVFFTGIGEHNNTMFALHTFMVVADNKPRPHFLPKEFRGGPMPGANGGDIVSVELDAVTGGPDKLRESVYAIELLHNDCSCDEYINKLGKLRDYFDQMNFPYDKWSHNSNSVTTTAAGYLGLKYPKVEELPWWIRSRMHGWGNNFPFPTAGDGR